MNTQPLHDHGAEQITLGAMLISEHAAERVSQIVTTADFYEPVHQAIYEAVGKARADHGEANAPLAAEKLIAAGDIHRVGGLPYLHQLTDTAPAAANGPYFARKVRALAVRRRILHAANTAGQAAHEIEGDDDLTDATRAVQRAIDELQAVRDFETGDQLETQTIHEFLAVEDEEYDWVVPGLLERGDRLMLTGGEGLGKSTILRQLAVTIAAGLHPFTQRRTPPKRVLIVDAENSDTQIRRKIRPLVTQARLSGAEIAEDKLWVEPRVGAMDLGKDRAVSWLLKRVNTIRPDVLVIGPLYKLSPRALQTDDDTAPILSVLDMIRDQGVCLLMEAHAGHATGASGKRDFRPRGSASLMGWPEFGYGLRPSENPPEEGRRLVELVPWRGDRDERDWPGLLTSGGRWPWSEALAGGAQVVNPYAERSA